MATVVYFSRRIAAESTEFHFTKPRALCDDGVVVKNVRFVCKGVCCGRAYCPDLGMGDNEIREFVLLTPEEYKNLVK